ncbi:metalloregulator ArsR/SmtB family transcription factor [Bacillus sp. 03113]|uniref:ArsR/SmtB family transcription factor n=1 Tax=Bacillus sp. 03113 TaxID=2578211 RepID=UPI0011450DD6|nr:metalloregulator ArsR/SmtB family transcription factor [Bacillus sp. 03113]
MGSKATIENFRNCIPLFQALSDEYRQDIILLLAEKERLTVNEIAEHSKLSRPAISHHLKILKQNNLVSVDQQGTKRYYSLALDTAIEQLKKLIQTVEEDCV